jgi:hypothetical protein
MRQLSRWFMALLAGGAVTWALWAILEPVLPDSSALATLGGFMVALFALHKLAQWAEARGWIYYQKRHGSWGAVGAAMSEVHAIYRPGERYVKQLKEDAHVYEEDDDEGDGRPSLSSTADPRQR